MAFPLRRRSPSADADVRRAAARADPADPSVPSDLSAQSHGRTPGAASPLDRRDRPDHRDRRALFLSRYQRLLGHARGLLGDRFEQAQDLVHDAFVQFVLGSRPIDTIDDLDAYLYGMLRKLHLSRLRRATRHPVLSLAEYDSVLVGLHALDGTAHIHALHDLASLGRYACVRKESSSAASIFILRFFWACPPPIVARLSNASPIVVAQRLRRARIEARAAIEAPQRLAFLPPRDAPPRIAVDPTMSMDEAQGRVLDAIIGSCRGACFTGEELAALYAEPGTPLPTPSLAHLASCPECLDRAARHLSIDEGMRPSIGAERRGAAPNRPVAVSRGRGRRGETPGMWLETVRYHRPGELFVFANGFLLGSQRVTGAASDLSVSARADEPLACVEVLSEQGVLLLFLDVESPFSGPVQQEASVAFGGGRTLSAAIDFSSTWPLVRVRYVDPEWIAATSSSAARVGTPEAGRLAPSTSTDSPPRRWLWGGHGLVWRVALAVFAGWLVFGGGVVTLASGAGRLWQWVSSLTSAPTPAPVRAPVPRQPPSPAPPLLAPPRAPSAIPGKQTPPPAPPPIAALGEAALVGLEVQVLERLDTIGALLGEQIECTRAAGQLRVSAIVDGEARAQAVRHALAPLADHPGLLLRVRTTRDVEPGARATQRGPRAPIVFHEYTVDGQRSAMQDDLRAHVTHGLDRRIPDTDAVERAARDAGRDIVVTSHRALRETWALRRLVERFSSADLTSAPPGTQEAWQRLVTAHLAAYRRELNALAQSLAFAARPSADDPEAAGSATRHDGRAPDIHGDGPRLLALATDVDRAVQASFRSSASPDAAPAAVPPVKTAAFWQALSDARALAAALDASIARPE